MEKIKIKSTSLHSAECSDIIIREGEQVRLVFRPEIVDNPNNAARVCPRPFSSRHLGGAISQVLHYRESLMNELFAVTQGVDAEISPAEPRCVVIAGCAEAELTDESRQRSFERFRERLTGVSVVTFDELFARVQGLVDLLEGV